MTGAFTKLETLLKILLAALTVLTVGAVAYVGYLAAPFGPAGPAYSVGETVEIRVVTGPDAPVFASIKDCYLQGHVPPGPDRRLPDGSQATVTDIAEHCIINYVRLRLGDGSEWWIHPEAISQAG